MKYNYILIVLSIVMLTSCTESPTNNDDSVDFLFKAVFTDSWLTPGSTGTIFINDELGNLLAEATISHNSTIEFPLPEDFGKSDQKIIVSYMNSHNSDNTYFNTHLYSYTDIDIGEEFIFIRNTGVGDPIGSITASFDDIPEHTGFIYSVNSRYRRSSSGSLIYYSPCQVDLYYEPDLFFVRINSDDNGPLYTILSPVMTDEVFEIGADEFSELESSIIDLPVIGNIGSVTIRGYQTINNYHSGYHYLDVTYVFDAALGEYTACYPTNTFPDYRTQITLYDDDYNWPVNNCLYYYKYGQIPDELNQIQADFDIVQYDNNSLEISPSGEYDQIKASWFYSEDYVTVYWNIYGPASKFYFNLPQFPVTLTLEYPQIADDSFSFYYAAVEDYTELNNYNEFLNIKFKSGDYFFEQVKEYCNRSRASGLAPVYSEENFQEMYQRRLENY